MLDWTAPRGTLDAVRALPRLARQARRARGAGRRRQRHRSLFARRDPRLPRAASIARSPDADRTGLRAFFNDSYEVDDATGQADGTPSLLRRVSAAARLRPPPASAGAPRPATRRRPERARARRLPRDDLGPAARHVHDASGAPGHGGRGRSSATRRTDRRRTCSISTRRATFRRPKAPRFRASSGRPRPAHVAGRRLVRPKPRRGSASTSARRSPTSARPSIASSSPASTTSSITARPIRRGSGAVAGLAVLRGRRVQSAERRGGTTSARSTAT